MKSIRIYSQFNLADKNYFMKLMINKICSIQD